MNYKLLTGPFAGCVAAEGLILDLPFEALDDDMQARILDWAESQKRSKEDLELLKEDYESSWESEEVEVEDEDIDLIPVSKW